MPTIDPKAIAAARRQRTRGIRKRIAVLATTAFLALFAAITVQMASGHDPVLTAAKAATSTQASTPSTTSSGDDSPTGGDDGLATQSSTSSASSGTSSSSGPSAVTTSQS